MFAGKVDSCVFPALVGKLEKPVDYTVCVMLVRTALCALGGGKVSVSRFVCTPSFGNCGLSYCLPGGRPLSLELFHLDVMKGAASSIPYPLASPRQTELIACSDGQTGTVSQLGSIGTTRKGKSGARVAKPYYSLGVRQSLLGCRIQRIST
jgi:hypothetical protein